MHPDTDVLDTSHSKEDTARTDAEMGVVVGDVANSSTAFHHVRTYVNFLEREIEPLWQRAATTIQRKVRFNDLWMFFQPGELLYIPPSSGFAQNSDGKNYYSAWRLSTMSADTLQDEKPDDITIIDSRRLDLWTYYIDYNGFSYGPVERKHTICGYSGEKDITLLDIYPMRYHKDSEGLKRKLRKQGELFQNVIRDKHLYYDGWTLSHGPISDAEIERGVIPESGDKLDRLADILLEKVKKSNNQKEETVEHIDGDVMIDFFEGYKAKSSIIMPSFGVHEFDDATWETGQDEFVIKCYADGPKSNVILEIADTTQRNDLVSNFVQSRHKKHSNLFQIWEKGNVTQIEGEDISLLPLRAIAYAFRERKFVMVDINALKPITTLNNVFKDLQIDENHKRVVKSLVKAHFHKQTLQKHQTSAILSQDLIQGKGAGLFILLHGVPGVGKTATAEAVAQSNKKPLFSITCGDLGFSPREVDENLRDIFRLAHSWDCVLLLDEADVFTSRRETSDIQRNALVSGESYGA